MRFLLKAFLFLIFAIVIGLVVSFSYVEEHITSPGPLTKVKEIVVPKGAGVKQIAYLLEREGVIEKPELFALWVSYEQKHTKLKAGEYHFDVAISPEDVITKLMDNTTIDRFVTIPEGLSSIEIIELLEATEHLTGAIVDFPNDGTILPETYHFSKGDTRADIVNKMQLSLDQLIDSLWEKRANNLPFDTREEALVLASIVEKETGIAGERAEIAGVFVNRLRKGMRLQSDPTVAYAVMDGQGKMSRPLSRADLKLDHPYNTYVIKGLPPTPITNSGRAAIEAVLNPAQTKALYFVADGTGGHAFATTLQEHNRNVAKWRKFQKQSN